MKQEPKGTEIQLRNSTPFRNVAADTYIEQEKQQGTVQVGDVGKEGQGHGRGITLFPGGDVHGGEVGGMDHSGAGGGNHGGTGRDLQSRDLGGAVQGGAREMENLGEGNGPEAQGGARGSKDQGGAGGWED